MGVRNDHRGQLHVQRSHMLEDTPRRISVQAGIHQQGTPVLNHKAGIRAGPEVVGVGGELDELHVAGGRRGLQSR